MAKSSFLPRRNKGYFGQKVTKTLFGNSPIIRTYAFLPFLSFPSTIRSRASYGGNPVFGRFLEPWVPVPRLREDKLHGNDADCVSPILIMFFKSALQVVCISKIQLLVINTLYHSPRRT